MRIRKTSQYIEGGAGLPSYFTDEINTGMKWIDGKPIYRQVYITTTYSTNNDIATSNPETIVSLKGFVQRSDYTNIYQPIPSRINNSGFFAQFVNCSLSASNIQVGLEFGTTLQSAIEQIIIVIEYTKTTD